MPVNLVKTQAEMNKETIKEGDGKTFPQKGQTVEVR